MKDELTFVKLFAQHPSIFIAAAVIFFGAIANAASMISRARADGRKHTWVDALIGVTIAGFSGMMFGLASQLVTSAVDHQLSACNELALYLTSGAGAFLGLTGINKLSESILDSLSRRIEGKK